MESLHHVYSIWFLTWIEFMKPDIAIILINSYKTRLFKELILSFHYIWVEQTWLENWKLRKSFNFQKEPPTLLRPGANSIFDIHNPYGIKLLTRLRLGLSHLRDHKFRYCFQHTLNPLYDCDNDTETIMHFFLHCPSFHAPRQTLLNNIKNINEQILFHGEAKLIQMFV